MTENVGEVEFSWSIFFKNAGIPDDDAIQYVELFEDNRIKKNMLLELNKTILQDMGINMAGDIIAILRHAKIVHAQEMRKSSSNKTVSIKSSTSCPSFGKTQPKRSAINEINEWIKVPGKTQLVKKESYETKQYSADDSRPATKVSLRSSPELSSGIGLGQWGLNVAKKKRTTMDVVSSSPPERYEKTGQDSISRKRSSGDVFTDSRQTQTSKRLQPAVDTIQEAEQSLKSNSDPVDAHQSVFERLDHSGNAGATPSVLKTTATIGMPQQAKDFEDQLQRVALTAVMECLHNTSASNKTTSAALPTRRSQPELRQTPDKTVAKSDTFDKLTKINTSRERPASSQPTKTNATSPSSVPRKVKLRMDTITHTPPREKSSKLDIMTRLGKQSVFTRLTN